MLDELRWLVEVVRLDGEGGQLKEKLPVSFEGLELLPVVGGFGGEGLIVDVWLILEEGGLVDVGEPEGIGRLADFILLIASTNLNLLP
jgi:hypothetical protein